MSLMSHAIRPKPYIESEITLDLDKIYEKSTAEYKKAFHKQRELQEKEIGCYFPVMGHRLLLKAVSLPEKTAGGLVIPDDVKEALIKKYDIGLVIGAGPESYMDKGRFPAGPRCKVGDWIDFSPMEKQPKNFNNNLCYFINDDRVNCPVLDVAKVVAELRKYT